MKPCVAAGARTDEIVMRDDAQKLDRLPEDRATACDESNDLVSRPKQVAMPDFGVVVYESKHAPGFVGELKDNYAKFHLVIAGHARWESGGRSHLLGPNTLTHISPGVPHRQHDLPNDPVTLYGIHYRPELLSPELSDALGSSGLLSLDLASGQVNQARQVRALFQEMLFEQDTPRL